MNTDFARTLTVAHQTPGECEYCDLRHAQIVALFSSPLDRLLRIAQAHSKDQAPGGMTSGDCAECGWTWPCPTHIWATTNRSMLATWDPTDDEPDNQQ